MSGQLCRAAGAAAVLAAFAASPAAADFMRDSFPNLTFGIIEDDQMVGQLYDGIYRSFQACAVDATDACDSYAVWRDYAFDAYAASAGCVHDGTMAACETYAKLRQEVALAYPSVAAAYPDPAYPEGTPDVPEATSLEQQAANLAAVFSRPRRNASLDAVQCQAISPECDQYDLTRVEAAQRAFLAIIRQPVPPPDERRAFGDGFQ